MSNARVSGGTSALNQQAQAIKQAPVHAAQDSLDKALAMLHSEIESLHSCLTPVLAPTPEGGDKTTGIPANNSVAGRIEQSAYSVTRAAQAVMSLRQRLEI